LWTARSIGVDHKFLFRVFGEQMAENMLSIRIPGQVCLKPGVFKRMDQLGSKTLSVYNPDLKAHDSVGIIA